jgi:hypothetical protein
MLVTTKRGECKCIKSIEEIKVDYANFNDIEMTLTLTRSNKGDITGITIDGPAHMFLYNQSAKALLAALKVYFGEEELNANVS